MKKIIIPMIALGCLCACDAPQDSAPKNPTYLCGNYEVEMTFLDDGNTMHAVIAGDAVDLSLAVSASGARYAGVLNDTPIVLWGKGDTWTMYVGPEETMVGCAVK